MKSKYQGIFTACAFSLVLAAIGGYYFSGIWQATTVEVPFRQAPKGEGKVPSDAEVKTMQNLMQKMPGLASPGPKTDVEVSMALFGQHTSATTFGRGDDQDTYDSNDGQYLLSATLLAGAARFCILDGRFLAEGALLPNGAVLTQIENRRVQIVRQAQTIWISFEESESGALPASETIQKGHS
jgi:hypothetical protein